MGTASGLRALLCACLVFATTTATARQTSYNVVKVTGWRSAGPLTQVYKADGTRQPPPENIRGLLKPGLLQWNPEYDLVLISSDPGGAYWVRSRELDLVFCEKPLVPTVNRVGAAEMNERIVMGSGSGCP